MEEVSKNSWYEVLSKEITPETVKRMGEIMALRAFKPFLSYADNIFDNLYRGLIRDIHRLHISGYILSDGYDFAQEAICFLCGHMGKALDDVIGTDRRGKILTVKIACFRTITRSMNKLLTNKRRSVCLDDFYKLAAPEVDESETNTVKEDYTIVDKTIEKLQLTEKQKNYLICLMETNSYSEAGRILSINKATIWVTIMRIQEKYIRIFSEPKFRRSL